MKLIIDIPDVAYEAYKEWHKNKVATVEQSLIALAVPYEDRPHGKWIFEKAGYDCTDGYICSECGVSFHTKVPYFSEFNFCPNCGAKMQKGGAE